MLVFLECSIFYKNCRNELQYFRNTNPEMTTQAPEMLFFMNADNLLVAIFNQPKKTFFFSITVFFHRHWQLTGQQEKEGDYLLFHSTTSNCSRTFRHLFATLHVRWLSHIFNRTACIYQTATRRDLPPYRITIWLYLIAQDILIVQSRFSITENTKSFLNAHFLLL